MKRKASDFIPNERYEHLIILPIGIDFRDPGKRSPFIKGNEVKKDTRPYKERFPEQYCVNCGQWMCGGTACCGNPKSPNEVKQPVQTGK